jgi:hypothetical protein
MAGNGSQDGRRLWHNAAKLNDVAYTESQKCICLNSLNFDWCAGAVRRVPRRLALRGIVTLCFKHQVCHHPIDVRRGRSQHCRGCAFIAECAYG